MTVVVLSIYSELLIALIVFFLLLLIDLRKYIYSYSFFQICSIQNKDIINHLLFVMNHMNL